MSSKKVEFASNQMPVLIDGSYSISLNHTLNYGDGNSQTFNKSHTFYVKGERFSLRPQEILKAFPPPNVLGKFDNVLPHVVLSRRTLPWERLPVAAQGAAADSPQKPGTATPPPKSWLAVLVFASTNAPTPVTGTLADLFPASQTNNSGGKLPIGTYSYGSAFASMDKFLQIGEAAGDACIYIDLPLNQFAARAPSLADLSWNAHVRSKTTTSDTFKTFYSVVVAGELPQPGQGAIAHLVSLEGMGDQLPTDDGTYSSAPAWTKIRLVTLYSWRYQVAPLEASFQHMLLGLNGGVSTQDDTTAEVGDSQLRLPEEYRPAASTGTLPNLPFDSGYTVLAGVAPMASAWYRGPFLPSTVTPSPATSAWATPLLPATKAESLSTPVAVGPAKDRSYAVAWQMGRLLALADKAFAIGQVTWKRNAWLRINTLLGQQNKLTCGSRTAYADLVRAVLKDQNKIKALLGDTLSTDGADQTLAIPQTLVDWLGRLAQLQLVPFNLLVPDSGMLPSESLRFFSVDPRWLACLLDGAWSLGRQPAADWAFDTAYQPWIQLMNGSLIPSAAVQGKAWPQAGFILNSQVIPGYWPGIEFELAPAGTNIIREDLLGQSTLLILLDQPVTAATLKQPSEGIHFGFDMDETGALSKTLRYVEIGSQFYPAPPDHTTVVSGQEAPSAFDLSSIPQRSATVIQFDKLAQAIANKIGVTDTSAFLPVDFAVELVESVSSVNFELPPAV